MLSMDTQTLLKLIGGQAAVALECDVTDSAVSQWASDDKLPDARRQYLRLAHPGAHWDEYEKTHPLERKRGDVAEPSREAA